MIAMDFGANDKLSVHGPDGPLSIPRVTSLPGYVRGMNSAEKFALKLRYLLSLDDVVTEAATIGASGAEAGLILKVVRTAPHSLYTLSGRVVKNYRKDHGLTGNASDAEAAGIQYEVATTKPGAISRWTGPREHRTFKYASPRPYDKRDYDDPEVEAALAILPAPELLPDELRRLLCDKKTGAYNPAASFMLARSLMEDGAESSRYWLDSILGFHSGGKPSYYRRKVNSDLMQALAKLQTGKKKVAEITPAERKTALQALRRYLRAFHHIWRGTWHPENGTTDPRNVMVGSI